MLATAYSTLFVLTLLPAALGAINGPCADGVGWCICMDRDKCRSWGGAPLQGAPGSYPCPNDPGNVWGCYIGKPCRGGDVHTSCSWRNQCTGTVFPGEQDTPTPACSVIIANTSNADPVCPGGRDFVCCVN